jgi:hypothetical protein
MKEKSENKTKIKKSALVVRPEIAARLKKFCSERGLKLQFATEQAVAEWLRKQTSEVTK